MIYWDFTTISKVYREWSKKEKISSERQLCELKCLVDVRGQRRMGRLVRDDTKATVTQITTRYNQGMQNTISERTTGRTLKQMGYSSRKPHQVPLLSAKNNTQRLQITQAPQIWTIEDWKNVMSLDFCCDIQTVVPATATSSRIMHHVAKLKSHTHTHTHTHTHQHFHKLPLNTDTLRKTHLVKMKGIR